MANPVIKNKNRIWLILNICLIIILLSLSVYYFPALLQRYDLEKGCVVSFIDVGQGDSAVIQIKGGTNILIDGGELFYPGTQKNSFKRTLKKWLKKNKVREFDLVIATHPHSDHIGGLTEILKNYPVTTVIDHGYLHESFLYKDLLNTVKNKRIHVIKPFAGQELKISEDAKLLFLSPAKENVFDDLNENSLVTKFIYKNISFLFTADVGYDAERWMIKNLEDYLKSDVLKVGHHGSSTSSSALFIKAVSPKLSVISCGRNNPHNHPEVQVLDVLENENTKVFRTDLHGTVTVFTDGEDVTVKTEK